ncbi:MAG: hypothetical protein H0V29_01610 [Thermoleophilaceae bacterium]|nr:hypothetical protein [Thermoleophilaceae bacterium]
MTTKKELRPTHDLIVCDICGRSILKGERTEAFLAPGGIRKIVCELCQARATHEGWIRESAHGDLPASRGPQREHRSLFGRFRGRGDAEPEPWEDVQAPGPDPEPGFEEEYAPPAFAEEPQPTPEEDREPAPAPPRSRPKDPRHVRAIPTNAEVKIERALGLFNGSEHTKTVAGIGRTLGTPYVSAMPNSIEPSHVDVVVAWELSWYRWRIDLGDSADAIVLLGKGEEYAELGVEDDSWNGVAAADGTLALGVVPEP